MTTSYPLAGNLQMPDGWEEYDIDAIAPGAPSDDDLRLMYQVLLAKNRPKLKTGDPNRKGTRNRRSAEPEPGVSRPGPVPVLVVEQVQRPAEN